MPTYINGKPVFGPPIPPTTFASHWNRTFRTLIQRTKNPTWDETIRDDIDFLFRVRHNLSVLQQDVDRECQAFQAHAQANGYRRGDFPINEPSRPDGGPLWPYHHRDFYFLNPFNAAFVTKFTVDNSKSIAEGKLRMLWARVYGA